MPRSKRRVENFDCREDVKENMYVYDNGNDMRYVEKCNHREDIEENQSVNYNGDNRVIFSGNLNWGQKETNIMTPAEESKL